MSSVVYTHMYTCEERVCRLGLLSVNFHIHAFTNVGALCMSLIKIDTSHLEKKGLMLEEQAGID